VPTMRAAEVWPRVAAERVALADELEALAPADWDAASLCAGWRVRDVVGHLVYLGEGTYRGLACDIVRHGRGVLPNRMLDAMAKRTAQAEPAELVERLRAAADGRFRAPGAPPAASLAEVIVHGQDIRRPLCLPAPERDPESLIPLLTLYRRIGVYFTRSGSYGVRLVATDVDWSAGSGKEVHGPALGLLVALAGRPPAPGELEGPGAETLRARTRSTPAG